MRMRRAICCASSTRESCSARGSSSSDGLVVNQQFNQRAFVAQLALRLALLVLHITQLVQVFVFARGNVVRHLEQAREEMIEERDQRRLAAKVQLQRFFFAARRKQGRRHLAKHVDVRAAKTVDRLLAIADDEQICRPAAFRECEPFEQHALHCVRVLKLVDEEKP